MLVCFLMVAMLHFLRGEMTDHARRLLFTQQHEHHGRTLGVRERRHLHGDLFGVDALCC
jgi:hypothetical protein